MELFFTETLKNLSVLHCMYLNEILEELLPSSVTESSLHLTQTCPSHQSGSSGSWSHFLRVGQPQKLIHLQLSEILVVQLQTPERIKER